MIANVVLDRRRTAVVALVAIVLSLTVAGEAAATPNRTITDTYVTWTIDHGAKTITAEIRLTLSPACTLNQMLVNAQIGAGSRCVVTTSIADDIKRNIESVWTGQVYYCYQLIAIVNYQIDNSPASPDPPDRLRVRIDQSPVAIRSFVTGSQSSTAPWNGSNRADAFRPENRGQSSSTWGYPPGGSRNANLYAHEAGHVLGLDDSYEDVVVNGKTVSQTRAGAPEDLMSHQKNSNVDPSTTRRMVERTGFSKTDLECNYRVDHPQPGGFILGEKCDDPPYGTWLADGIYWMATADGDQTWIIEITGGQIDMWVDGVPVGTLTGTYTYTDEQTMEVGYGVTVFTEGNVQGEVELTFDAELRARMQLRETSHTFRSRTSVGGWGQLTSAPLQSSEMIWEPIGLCTP